MNDHAEIKMMVGRVNLVDDTEILDVPKIKPVIYPVDESDKGIVGAIYQGFVLDSETGEAIPGASILLTKDGNKLKGGVADKSGYFQIITGEADEILITAAEYEPYRSPASTYQDRFELVRIIKTLEPVVIAPGTQTDTDLKKYLPYGILAALFLLASQKKKQVGKIDTTTVFLAVAGIVGISLASKLFTKIGIWNGPGEKDTQHEQANPYSPWKPAFWQSYQGNQLLIKEEKVQEFIKTIHNAFTVFQDDFNAIMSVFSQLKTKSQVSYLSDKFNQRYDEDLLSFLKDGGGILPWDGLSDSHLKTLNDLVNNLPNYQPK